MNFHDRIKDLFDRAAVKDYMGIVKLPFCLDFTTILYKGLGRPLHVNERFH